METEAESEKRRDADSQDNPREGEALRPRTRTRLGQRGKQAGGETGWLHPCWAAGGQGAPEP